MICHGSFVSSQDFSGVSRPDGSTELVRISSGPASKTQTLKDVSSPCKVPECPSSAYVEAG